MTDESILGNSFDQRRLRTATTLHALTTPRNFPTKHVIADQIPTPLAGLSWRPTVMRVEQQGSRKKSARRKITTARLLRNFSCYLMNESCCLKYPARLRSDHALSRLQHWCTEEHAEAQQLLSVIAEHAHPSHRTPFTHQGMLQRGLRTRYEGSDRGHVQL